MYTVLLVYFGTLCRFPVLIAKISLCPVAELLLWCLLLLLLLVLTDALCFYSSLLLLVASLSAPPVSCVFLMPSLASVAFVASISCFCLLMLLACTARLRCPLVLASACFCCLPVLLCGLSLGSDPLEPPSTENKSRPVLDAIHERATGNLRIRVNDGREIGATRSAAVDIAIANIGVVLFNPKTMVSIHISYYASYIIENTTLHSLACRDAEPSARKKRRHVYTGEEGTTCDHGC